MIEDNIYVIRVFDRQGKSYIKVGYSEKIKDRLYTYYIHNPFIEVVMTLYYPDAKNLEISLHKTFKSIILNEWYKEENLQDILEYIKNYNFKEGDKIFNVNKNEKIIILSYEENKKLLKALSPKEYFFLMKLVEITNDEYLIIGVSSNTSARNLSILLDISRKEVFNYMDTLIDLSIIKLEEGKYYLNSSFLKKGNN